MPRAGSRYGKLERDPALVATVVAEYENGGTLHGIACRHKVSWQALRAKLVECGVEIRRNPPPPRLPHDAPYEGRRTLTEAQIARLRAAIGFNGSWVA